MIEFPLLYIWSKFYHKAIVSYYTQSHARSKESGETEHSVHGAEAESPSISTCHVAAHASGLGECDVYVGGKVRVSEFMIFLDLQHCGSK